MKIGILGPRASIDRTLQVITDNKPGIEYIALPANTDEAPEVAARWQTRLDALLFTGYGPYSYACRTNTPVIPWDYMSRTSGALLATLLNISYVHKLDIGRITYDLQEDATASALLTLQADMGIRGKVCSFCDTCAGHESISYYVNDAIAFHLSNLSSHKADLCITGMKSVADAVIAKGYPAFWIAPLAESIRQEINQLILRCRMEQAKQNTSYLQPVVLSLDVTTYINNESLERSEFSAHRIASGVADAIYTFAQRTDSAVEFHENGVSFLYTLRGPLDIEQSNASLLRLCRAVQQVNGVKQCYIGAGTCMSTNLAKAYAKKALNMAKLQNASCYCLISMESHAEHIAGPFLISDKPEGQTNPRRTEYCKEVSRRTGLGLKTVQTLADVLLQYGIDVTTAKELASLCGMGSSNMNRVLNKLETAGYLETVGQQPLGGAGRPQKLIHLRFETPTE